MKKAIIFGLLSIIWSFTIAQNTVGLLQYDPLEVSPGMNLFFPHNQSSTFLMNNCGEVVHTWSMADTMRPGNSVYLLENGLLVRCSRPNNIINDVIWAGGGGQFVDLVDWEGNITARFELNNDSFRLHHDIEPLSNGNILMIVWERIGEEEALLAGRRAELLPDGEVWSEKIIEWNPSLDSLVWEWRVWDHLVQNQDESLMNFGMVHGNYEQVDINYDEHDGHPDWLHINAIDYNPVLDQIVLSVPYFNEFWIIDHSTSLEEARSNEGGNFEKGGRLLYRWGNPKTYIKNRATNQHLFFQHDVQWLNPIAEPGTEDFGKIVLFNNRYAEDYSVGMVVSTFVDLENKTYSSLDGILLPEQEDFIIQHPDNSPKELSDGLSSIQRLSNGNWLLLYGRWGYAIELNEEHQLVWEYIIPLKGGAPIAQGSVLASNNNLTFRFNRYPIDYPAFQGKNLDNGQPLEMNPNNILCSSTSVQNHLLDPIYFRIGPNPAEDLFNLKINGNQKVEFVKLYNISGQLEQSWNGVGLETQPYYVGFLNAGLYIVQTNLGSQPLIIQKK